MFRRLAAILICCWCATACGQSTPPAAAGSAAETPPPPAADESPDRVFVQDADGRWVPRPDTQNEIDRREGDREGAVAAYIAQLQLDGEVTGESADMTARIRVEVTRDDGWYELPLALDQAFIYDVDYTGDGKHAPVVTDGATGGLRWLFTGAGTHRLEFKFRLPIRGTAAGRQLQLTLPQLPPNYVTRAVLRIPDAHVLPAESVPGVTLRKRTLETGGTELECDVSSSRWELAWRTETDDVPRISKVVTSMRVSRDGGVLRLTAVQECTLERNRLTEILVRQPTAFDLESVELVGATAETMTAVPELGRPGWSRVRLGDELQGNFTLEWQFQAGFPPPQGLVTVDGLEIEGARRQLGRIEVAAIPGYAARYRAEESTALWRGDVGERRADEPMFDFRFDFQRQPCVLTYELTPVEAQTDASTEVFLSIGANRSDLYLALDLEVISGQVHEIVLDWLDYSSSGWLPDFSRAGVEVDSGGAASELVDATLDQDALAADPHQLRLQLSRPCSGSLRTTLHFFRVLPPQSGTLNLVLPRPAAKYHASHALTIASAFNLETTISTPDGTLQQVPRGGQLPAGVPSQFLDEDARAYDLPEDPPPISLTWSQQNRSISAESTLAVERRNAATLRVVQTIDYDVAYGYVSTLALDAGANRTAQQPAAAGSNVTSEGQALETEVRDNLLRIKLKEPRRGRFSVSVEQFVAAPSAGPGDRFTIPVLQSVDAPFKSTIVRFPDAGPLRLADDEAGWQSWQTRSGDSGWLTTAQRRDVRLVADETSQNLPQQFTIDSAFVQTSFGDPGQTLVHAVYALRDAPARVALTLPQHASVAEFHWNGSDLAPSGGVHPAPDAPGRFVLTLSDGLAGTQSGRLTVQYRAPRSAKPGLVSAYAVQFPQFGDKVVVDDSDWEIVLPSDEQLSSPPAGLVPQYSWERETAMWARRLTPDYLARRAAMLGDDGNTTPRGNVYAYSTIGPLPEGRFGAMAISVIVLIGAGFSLLLGFVFRRIPATRNLLSILVLGFLFALGGLWQLELMQLLLQPAALGLLLAAIAASFDVARRDRAALPGSSLDNRHALPERQSSTSPLGSSIPARTAVYHPDVGEPGRTA